MAYASKSGRARTSASSPQAHAICDRCGARVNFVDLRWQYDYRGFELQNLRILVCDHCLDEPQQQLRSIIVPPDPEPIINARPENFQADSTSWISLTSTTKDPTTGLPIPNTTIVTTTTGQPVSTQPVGRPRGLSLNAQMPLVDMIKWAQPIPFLSILTDGTQTVSVTCSSPHNLSTNAQVAVAGTSDPKASGVYSVSVTTATAFTYQANVDLVAASQVTGSTLMVTTDVGIPWGFDQIPAT